DRDYQRVDNAQKLQPRLRECRLGVERYPHARSGRSCDCDRLTSLTRAAQELPQCFVREEMPKLSLTVVFKSRFGRFALEEVDDETKQLVARHITPARTNGIDFCFEEVVDTNKSCCRRF